MQASVLAVVRCGKQWGVSANGEVLALARRKRDAQGLAESAAQILRDSGGEARVTAPAERRSFAPE